MPSLSLIVATIARDVELRRLLRSLTEQTEPDFEVIVVDQNADDRARAVIAEFESVLRIGYAPCRKGASRARNAGAALAKGAIVGFPDDDCWYPSQTTSRVLRALATAGIEGLAGRVTDPVLGTDIYPFLRESRFVDLQVLSGSVSASAIFVRRAMFQFCGGFNEAVGPGAGTIWGGMEEHDLAARYLKAGGNILYDPDLVIHHPAGLQSLTPHKTREYNGGKGFINALYPEIKPGIVVGLARSLAGAVRSLLRLRLSHVAINLAAFRGRLTGYVQARRQFRGKFSGADVR